MIPPRRIIAIGDIHGYSRALERLLEAIAPASDDWIVTLGDYVDRGPDSRGVIERLVRLQQECTYIPLLGNHEVMWIGAIGKEAIRPTWLWCGGESTLASYGGSYDLPESHWDFLCNCRPWHEIEEAIFVHANYDPDLPMAEQPDHLLFWEHMSRPRRPHRSGKPVFVGHTPQTSGEVLDTEKLVMLDTFIFGGGYVSAMEISSRRIWQADAEGRLREERPAGE